MISDILFFCTVSGVAGGWLAFTFMGIHHGIFLGSLVSHIAR